MRSLRFSLLLTLVPFIAPLSAWAQPPTLYTVGYAHLDTQWRWSYKATIENYIPRTLLDNFDRADNYPDYIFNFSGAYRYQMMKEYYPADYDVLKQYIANNRWFPCGSSMDECDSIVPGAESLIRHVLYGNHFFRQEFNKASEEFMLPDCFGFPASLPSILTHCGIKGFSTQKLTWGSAVGIPFNVGVWVGPDGSGVIAALNPGAYVASIDHDLSEDTGWLDRIDATGDASGVYKDYMYYGTGDMGGAPNESSVQWLETSVNGTGPVHVLASNADQMFIDIPQSGKDALVHYQGDLLLTQHSAGSITSQAYMKRWNFKNERLASAAERVSAFAEWLGGPAYPLARLNRAWAKVLGAQMHDILPGTSHPKAYEYSWNDEILALNQFADVTQSAVGAIASDLDTTATGTPLVVYNPLSVDRQDVVEATIDLTGPAPAAIRVVGPDSTEVPSQITSVEHGKMNILFLADVPSVGLAVYDVQPAATPAASSLSVTQAMLENDRYIIALNGSGDVASIFDKVAQRPMLSSAARLAFSHDYPSQWPAWNIDWDDASAAPEGYVDGPADVEIVENGAARVALQITRDARDSHFVQTIRLSAGDAGNRIEFDNKINWKSAVCNFKAVFPLSVSNPNATYNWEVGTVQRGNDTPSKYEVPAHYWFDLTDTDGTYGTTVLSDCKYGSNKPDDQTLRLTLLRTPGASGGYQDQATQDWGEHDILYGLAGHAGDWRDGQTDWQALRLSQPPIVFQTTAHSGSLGRSLSLLSVDNPRVRVMAVKKAEDSNEMIVRLVELDGQPQADVHVSLPTGIASAQEVDGQERPVGPATVTDGELVTDIGSYQLRAFAITPGTAPTQVPAVTQQTVTLPFNRAVTSADGQTGSDGFDDAGYCIPAEMLPDEVDYRAITFAVGPTDGGELNAVACDGQQIALPSGSFSRLYLLAAGANGEQTATFLVDGEPTELTIQDWGGFIGQWDNRIWDGGITEVAYNWPWAYVGLEPAYIHRDPVAWFSSHRHTPGGANDVYAHCYLFAYTLDLPPGAATLTLPTNNHVLILAATAADDPGADTTPAHPLYDVLERVIVVPPVMTPITATGWNRDVIVEQGAVDPLGDHAEPFDVPNSYAYYENGLAGSAKGLPQNGAFVSLADNTTQVQLQPYDALNTLFIDTTDTTGTLTFDPGDQTKYDRLAVFAASANASSDSTGPLTITFTDDTTADVNYNGYDWFFVVAANAINDLGRVRLPDATFEDNSDGNPRIYQTTLDLKTLGLNDKPIKSLTFGLASGSSSGRTTCIFAVSGARTQLALDLNCDDETTIDDVMPFTLALIDPDAYDAAYPDCDQQRADVNGDGFADGADIQAFIDALLQP